MIHIIENTLRDGSYTIDFQFSKEDTYNVVGGLDKLGFDYIEIGHGMGLGAGSNPKMGLAKETDEAYISAARKGAKNAKIGVFFIPGIGKKEDIRIAKEKGIDFIRVGINIDNYELTRDYLELAKKEGLMVCINLMKSYAVKSYEFSKIAIAIDSWELADVIYLVDSAGCMIPDEVFEYIDRTKERIKIPIGFHGHNNLSLAIANTLQAIKAGATYVDTCIRGMGRSAGNAQTEITVYLLKQMNLLHKDIDLYATYDFANEIVVPLMKQTQGLTDEEIHIGVSKFHTSFMPYVNNAADKFKVDKRKLIKKVSDINCLNPSEALFLDIASLM